MKAFVALSLVAGALLLGATPARVGAAVHFTPRGVVPHFGQIRSLTRAAGMTSTPTCGSVGCTAYESGINQYFTDVAAASTSHATDNVYSVASQYSDTTGPIAYASTFGGSFVDTSAYPGNGCNDHVGSVGDNICLTDAQLQTEIRKDITAAGWPNGGTSNLFFILTPSGVGICADSSGVNGQGCSTNVFCAYHDDFSGSGGSNIVYAVEPDNATIPGGGCDSGEHPNNADIDPSINTISHEMIEAITDPLPEVQPGWWTTGTESEIGDLCAWTFGTALGGSTSSHTEYNQAINGHHYWLQEEYSNHDALGPADACVQRYGGQPSIPSSPSDGVGPLVYQGGPVMRTNTVYAIYWVPSGSSAPASTAPPVVSGVAAVGKTLSTSDGSWSGSPTSFAYQWQSCSATGTSCTDISGATGATYALAAGDADHEIRSEVSATNAGGSSSYAASTPTEAVVPVPAATAAPVVSGVVAVGRTLSTTQGTWNTPVTYAYQWLRCSSAGTSCSSIAKAATSTYKLTTSDRGHELEARVSATNAAATRASLSAPTVVVVGLPASSRLPTISGRTKVGRRLSVDTGRWSNSPSRFRYQWLRCGSGGGSCVRIKSATKSTYRLTRHDARHRLRVRVTAANLAGTSRSTSSATRVVRR